MYNSDITLKMKVSDLEQIKETKKSLVVTYISNELFQKNSNFIAAITGLGGMGKSWTALKLGEQIMGAYPVFNIHYVVWSIQELLELLVELQNRHEAGEKIRGTVIVYEEGGVSLSSRNWQDKIHEVINNSIETFRWMGVCLLLTLPSKERMDVRLRTLMHGVFEVIEKKSDCRIVKFNLIKYDAQKQKEIYPYLKVQNHGWITKVKTIKVMPPSPQLVRDYEAKMLEFKKNINVEGLARIKGLQSKNSVNQNEDRQMLTKVQKSVWDLKLQGLDNAQIGEKLGLSDGRVSVVLSVCRRKGWNWKEELAKRVK